MILLSSEVRIPTFFKPHVLLLVFFCLTSTCFSQDIKGKLLDEKGLPVEGAYIVNARSTEHWHSNALGYFFLRNVQIGDTLNVGGLGFKKLDYIVSETDFNERITLRMKEDAFLLDEVVIRPEINGLNVITAIDLVTAPVKSSQEILQKVPGLIIGQHAGGGKAEQLFLRGFDIDHGTDIAISVDGIPVNMVSHAHGQGYADLHFVIPETIKDIDFGKGPFYASQGNFATAAYVNFETREVLQNSLARVELGDFGYNRILGLFNVANTDSKKGYLATEFIRFDGPFESPQNFSRINMFGKYTSLFQDNSKFSLSASHFTSTWNASGQIPTRAVNNGIISRFGAIDDTEGGTTQRTNINTTFQKVIDDNTFIKTNSFYSKYDFLLFSNFTFFLNDSVNGDQIKQNESRDIFGLNTELNKSLQWNDNPVLLQMGGGFRSDKIANIELSGTLNRKTTLERIQLGDISESNFFGYVNTQWKFDRWTFAPALRLDHFNFSYVDALQEDYESKVNQKTFLAPKFNIMYSQNQNLQYFLKTGIGFHSNDTRVIIAGQTEEILPAAYGIDMGIIARPLPSLFTNVTAWYMFLEQEFVYVGDAGIVEPSGKTERYGLDLGLRYQATSWLYLNTDATFTIARSTEEPKGQNFIPLAPDITLVGGLNINNLGKFSGGIQYRYLDNRPANEDNSIVAKGYFVTDLNINYNWTKNLVFAVSVENLFDTEWNETQFATESRLLNESASVEEIHFTPGIPFFIKGSVAYQF